MSQTGQEFILGMLLFFVVAAIAFGRDIRIGRMEPIIIVIFSFIGGVVAVVLNKLLG